MSLILKRNVLSQKISLLDDSRYCPNLHLFRQLKYVDGPEALWARTSDMRLSGDWATIQKPIYPLLGDRVPSVNCAKLSAIDTRQRFDFETKLGLGWQPSGT